MEADEKSFSRMLRSWIDRQRPPRAEADAVWSRISRAMELSQGPTPRRTWEAHAQPLSCSPEPRKKK